MSTVSNLNLNQKRVEPTENTKLLLFSEVGGVCPRCPTMLMYNKNKRNHKRFEIAHIFPINPTSFEAELLKDEEIINDDLNHTDNLICLCVDCHTKFDKPRTVVDYRELLQTKKWLIEKFEQKKIWDKTPVEEEILQVIDVLANEDFVLNPNDELNYDPRRIDQKLDTTATLITKRKVHRSVQDYYYLIKDRFKALDQLEPTTTEVISNQIRNHYLQLKKLNSNSTQKEVYDAMSKWLAKQTNQNDTDACEIIISYFIQNCEIFE